MLTDEKYNLVKIYERSFREHWDLPAVSDWGTNKSWTYGELATVIAHLHVMFEENGLKKDDKVALMGRNNSCWVATFLATVTYGAIVVPILQDFKADDAIHIINHSDAKLLFISDNIWEGIDLEQIPNVKVVVSLNDWHPISQHMEVKHITMLYIQKQFVRKFCGRLTREMVHYDERPNDAVASINYTSGTTGFSKGVITPCNALAGNIKFGVEDIKLTYPGARHVAFLPLAHAYGCAFDFLACLAAGGHVFLVGRTPAPKILLKAFADVKPTIILSVPLILEKIYKKMIVPQISKAPVSWVLKIPYLDEIVLSKIRQTLIDAFGGEFRQIIIGGAPLNAEVEAFLRRIKFPVSVGYGMTECAPLISFTEWEEYKTFSCGRVLPGIMEARIAKPDEDGVGEIEVRGENVMYGYYKNEEATRLTFSKDGWLKTGDLGMIDEDGFIFIKGRNKTMLLGPSGQNIYPEEIEAKLDNMPYVSESLVLQNQDSQLVALVCPDMEAVDANHLTEAQLEEAMEANRRALNPLLASYEPIVKIKIYPHEFEKTPKKSIKRFLYTNMAD